MSIRRFKPTELCNVNGYLVEVIRHARRTSFVRVLDTRLPGRVVVQLDKKCEAQRAPWHEALLEANRMVTEKNLGRQDSFLNRVEDRLDDACLGVRDLVTERDALVLVAEAVINGEWEVVRELSEAALERTP